MLGILLLSSMNLFAGNGLISTSPHPITKIINQKTIYAFDNRKDIYEVNSVYKELAKATAVQINHNIIEYQANGQVSFYSSAFGVDYRLCANEKFSEQFNPGRCSGFLIGPNTLVTAGHCVQNEADCSQYAWVFDYQVNSKEAAGKPIKLAKENVYSCKRIISQKLTALGIDYAVIELNRNTTGRTPFKVRKKGKVKKGDELVMIGNPVGLPTKVTDGAKVIRNIRDNVFKANLDAFGGNSGSAVINSKTFEVEGILVRGGQDFIVDKVNRCVRSNICKENISPMATIFSRCPGEAVTRITEISGI